MLYVADSGNKRVQRFSKEGLFAGEARSQSSGGYTGFVLGDFGSPGNIAVNSGHFYILDGDTELVHVFETSVIHSIDDKSAWVEYQSNSNYVGPDFFTFQATDGFHKADGTLVKSAAERVDINVSRNFRPPQATVGLFISTTEDTPAGITLSGYDLDGALDKLTYRVETPPSYGKFSGAAPNLTYTPNPNFYGNDAFTFVVNDGRDDSQPQLVPISVAPANDPPSVILRSDSAAGVGFPFTLDALIVDPDYTDTHTLRVEWGDGSSQSNGQIQSDGSLSGPVIVADDTITSTVLGYHTYTGAGNMALRVCATDTGGLEGCASQSVAVQASVDLALSRQGAAVVPADRRTLTYALMVENRHPSAGGVAAANVVLQETLAQGATYQKVEPNGSSFTCTAGGQTLRCPIGGLASGATAQVIITVALDNSLQPGAEIQVDSRVQSSTPEAIEDNNALTTQLALLPAADFYVTSLADGNDTSPGDGICAASDGCTLRAAVEEANALPGMQRIAIGYGVHQLNLAQAKVSQQAAATSLSVTDDLTIMGLSADRSIVNANGLSRIFDLKDASLTLQDLMLSGGAPGKGDGGAILAVNGDLRLERVAVAGNQASNGGGLLLQNGSATIIASAFTGNQTASGGNGGAIENQGGNLKIQNSTFGTNQAARGGALHQTGGSAALQNVTVVGNNAGEEGGGIHNTGNNVTLADTILSGNSAPLGPNCLGRFSSDGHNLLGNLDSCTVLGQTGSNVLVQDTEWDAIVRTLSGTYAYPLPVGSRAIDAGSCALPTDQQGAARSSGNGCDIGAMEYNPLAALTKALYLPSVARLMR